MPSKKKPAKKVDHTTVMAGLTAVVRAALDGCAADGVPVHQDMSTSLALIESWLAGTAVSAASIGAARDAAWKAGERTSKEARGIGGSSQYQDRAAARALLLRASHLAVAVGNLCVKALKDGAWKDLASVMDSSSWALPALGEAGLEQVRKKAAKAGPAPKIVTPPKPARMTVAELAPLVGPLLAARAYKLGVRRQADAPKDASAFDARYGGITIKNEDGDWLIGAAACAADGAHVAPAGARTDLTAVAYAGDLVFFLDTKGAAWAEDTIEDPEAALFARSGDHLFAKLVARACMWTAATVDGKHGAQLAKTLKLKPIREATDEHSALWGDAKVLVLEDATTTHVLGISASALKKLVVVSRA